LAQSKQSLQSISTDAGMQINERTKQKQNAELPMRNSLESG
jgi:hypothetical protein